MGSKVVTSMFRRAIAAIREIRRNFGVVGPLIIAMVLVLVLGMALYVALFV
jgi:hypothetical protein